MTAVPTRSTILNDPRTRRWIGWGLLILAVMLVSLFMNASGVLSSHLAATFNVTGFELGLLHSSYVYAYGILQLPAGVMVDRFGTRKIAGWGALIMSLGMVGFANAGAYWTAVGARFLAGIGSSVIVVAGVRFTANWFRADEFATISGFAVAFSRVGQVLATAPLAILVAAVGWRSGLSALGAVGTTVAGGIYVAAHGTPLKAGVSQIGSVASPAGAGDGSLTDPVRNVLGDLGTWLLGAYAFVLGGTVLTLFGLWGIPYLVHVYGLSVESASMFLLGSIAGGIVGAPMLGWLSDALTDRMRLMIVSGVAIMICYGSIAVFESLPLLLVGAILVAVGIFSGTTILLITVMKERHPGDVSTAAGTINGIAFLGGAVFPVALGSVLDAFWTGESIDGARIYTQLGYRVAFGIAGISVLVGVVCLLLLSHRQG